MLDWSSESSSQSAKRHPGWIVGIELLNSCLARRKLEQCAAARLALPEGALSALHVLSAGRSSPDLQVWEG